MGENRKLLQLCYLLKKKETKMRKCEYWVLLKFLIQITFYSKRYLLFSFLSSFIKVSMAINSIAYPSFIFFCFNNRYREIEKNVELVLIFSSISQDCRCF